SLKTSIKTITYLSDIGCLEIQGASLVTINDDSFTGTGCHCGLKGHLYTVGTGNSGSDHSRE
ncbi:hypothetical protein, partial [Salmonella sp. zj-f50]|uniref:hypothetical protein n=1 Tax=Salmonella sp. zj-f50 TaxID=2582616 RepID=UPI001F44A4BF